MRMRSAAPLLVLAAITVAACDASLPKPSPSDAPPELAWAAYQAPDPRYRLIFEGSADGRPVTDVRIIDGSGNTVASVATSVSASEPMRMCGRNKSDTALTYGPSRATFVVGEDLFRTFLDATTAKELGLPVAASSSYRVEAKVAGTWRTAALKLNCAATID